MESVQPSAGSRLIRGIGPWALTAFAINITVGAGIFGLPARIQALVGNYSVIVLIVCGLLMALVALCFAEVGSRFDRSGGPQLYASIALGPLAGFAAGWLLWVSRLGTCGAVANLLIDYGTTLWLPLAEPLARAAIISTLAFGYGWINIRGIRQTATVSTVFTVSKLIPLILFAAAGLFFIEPHAPPLGPVPRMTDVSTAILLATFAYFGFDATTVIAGEVRNPSRSIPFAILLSVGCVIILYALVQITCVGALPGLATSQRPLAEAATVFLGPSGPSLIAVAAAIACAGVFGASMTAATRLLFAMSDDRQLPAALARVHSAYRTPVLAIVATVAAVWLLALSGSFIYLVKLTLVARVTVYATTCVTLVIFRHTKTVPEASFRVPAGEPVACASALLCVVLLASSSMRELLDVGVALAIGLTVFGLARHASAAVTATR